MPIERGPASIRWRLAVLLIASLVPLSVFWGNWQKGGVLVFPHFGEVFQANQLPELQAFDPPVFSRHGYDGQFYAQMALNPLLTDPAMAEALDAPSYRARRIGLPLMAAVLGAGHSAYVLTAYSLLNFAFWAVLAWLLVSGYLDRSLRSLAAVLAVLWTSGAIVSMDRALTDLPAAVLGLLAAHLALRNPSAPWLMAFSALVKDTSVVSMAAMWPRFRRLDWQRRVGLALVLLLPVAAWTAYVFWRMPPGAAAGVGNFSLPGLAWWAKVQATLALLFNLGPGDPALTILRYLVELAAPLSLAVQAAYLLLRWRPNEPLWGFGIGFAVLTFLIGPSVWAEFMAYTRVLLPLTIAFNLLLLRDQTQRTFWPWFIAGNCGLAGGLWLALS